MWAQRDSHNAASAWKFKSAYCGEDEARFLRNLCGVSGEPAAMLALSSAVHYSCPYTQLTDVYPVVSVIGHLFRDHVFHRAKELISELQKTGQGKLQFNQTLGTVTDD